MKKFIALIFILVPSFASAKQVPLSFLTNELGPTSQAVLEEVKSELQRQEALIGSEDEKKGATQQDIADLKDTVERLEAGIVMNHGYVEDVEPGDDKVEVADHFVDSFKSIIEGHYYSTNLLNSKSKSDLKKLVQVGLLGVTVGALTQAPAGSSGVCTENKMPQNLLGNKSLSHLGNCIQQVSGATTKSNPTAKNLGSRSQLVDRIFSNVQLTETELLTPESFPEGKPYDAEVHWKKSLQAEMAPLTSVQLTVLDKMM